MAEKVARFLIVCGVPRVAYRVERKRRLGQMTAIDLVVLPVVNDNSLAGGLLGVTSIPEEDGHVSVIPRRPVLA